MSQRVPPGNKQTSEKLWPAGHPVGATGVKQILEVYRQMKGAPAACTILTDTHNMALNWYTSNYDTACVHTFETCISHSFSVKKGR